VSFKGGPIQFFHSIQQILPQMELLIYRSANQLVMPFCRECGKEINNEWVTCPFCSVSLQIDTPTHSNNCEGPQGTPSPDWKDVLHNGQLIELVPSDDWEYYWANDEWHSINQPISEVPSSNSKAMSSNTMAPPSGSSPSSFHPTRGMPPRSSPTRLANINYEMFEEDDDDEDEKKPRSLIAELLKLILFDIPTGLFATEVIKQGSIETGIMIMLGVPLIHLMGPNNSKSMRTMIQVMFTLWVLVILAGILYVWADSLAQGAADEGTWEGDAGSSQLIGSWVADDGSTTTYDSDGRLTHTPPFSDVEVTSWRIQCEWPQCTEQMTMQMIIEQEQYIITATAIYNNAVIGDVLFHEITSLQIDGSQEEITDGECIAGVRANRITSDSSWNDVVDSTDWPSFCDTIKGYTQGTFVWSATDLPAATSEGIDDLVRVQMDDGNSLNWAVLKVTITINGGTPMSCAADNSTACSYSYYQNSGGNDAEWETGEGIVISEGDAGDCDGTDNCNVGVTLVSDDVTIGNFVVTVS